MQKYEKMEKIGKKKKMEKKWKNMENKHERNEILKKKVKIINSELKNNANTNHFVNVLQLNCS